MSLPIPAVPAAKAVLAAKPVLSRRRGAAHGGVVAGEDKGEEEAAHREVLASARWSSNPNQRGVLVKEANETMNCMMMYHA